MNINKRDLRGKKAADEDFITDKRRDFDLEKIDNQVGRILREVKSRGDEALLHFTHKFDGVKISPEDIRVSEEEINAAVEAVSPELFSSMKKAVKNISDFHELQRTGSLYDDKNDGRKLGLLNRPVECAGIYVPGGSAPLFSTVLMNAIPAKTAGVKRIVMCTPPGTDGGVACEILAAAYLVGCFEIYKAGGAQAIAAMAYGTETIPKADKIVGPGNMYVAAAKRMVFGVCGIDSVAGPSEITIIADKTANAEFIAADMLSQAEHDPMTSAVLISTDESLANDVEEALEKRLNNLPRRGIAESALASYGKIILTDSIPDAIHIANRIAPEHLELCFENAGSVFDQIINAGAVFIGNYSPEPLGDYIAGTNHVLPTGGTARFSSPLNVADFCKKISVIDYSEAAFMKAADDVIRLAEAEGLNAHAEAIRVRKESLNV